MAKTKEASQPQAELFQPPAIKEKPAAEEIADLKKGVGDLVIRMGAVKITDDASYKAAIELGKEGNEAIKRLKAAQAKMLDKPEGWVKRVKAAFKGIISAIEVPQDQMRDKCAAWNRKQEEKRQAEIARLADKKAQEEKKLETAETAVAQVKTQTKVDNIQDRIETLQTTKEKETARKRVVTVLDESLVPREYLSVDMTKLNAAKGAVGTPVPEIPGVRIADELAVAFR